MGEENQRYGEYVTPGTEQPGEDEEKISNVGDGNMAAQLNLLSRHLTQFGVLLWDLRNLKARLKHQVHGTYDAVTTGDDGDKIPSDPPLVSVTVVLGGQLEELQSIINDMSGHMGSFDKVSGVGSVGVGLSKD